MELRQLRYFVALVDTRSFTHAAESLYVSQSTLSEQVGALERELGVQLVTRAHKKIEPTAAGYALVRKARHILSEADNKRRSIMLAQWLLMCAERLELVIQKHPRTISGTRVYRHTNELYKAFANLFLPVRRSTSIRQTATLLTASAL